MKRFDKIKRMFWLIWEDFQLFPDKYDGKDHFGDVLKDLDEEMFSGEPTVNDTAKKDVTIT